jgi:hypothetical protein
MLATFRGRLRRHRGVVGTAAAHAPRNRLRLGRLSAHERWKARFRQRSSFCSDRLTRPDNPELRRRTDPESEVHQPLLRAVILRIALTDGASWMSAQVH